ncbi:MAG TPA: nuclear transport factor 2 family protein [Acidimicrobiales bacterium]
MTLTTPATSTDATGPDALDLTAEVRRLRDEREVVDALYRFGAGQDRRDETLFLSAFALDAELDFTEPAERFGGDIPVMQGRDVIAGILATLAPLRTTHTVTNPRVTLDGDRATLSALVEAQHVRRDDPARHLLLKNTYDVDLVRDGGSAGDDDGRWVVRRMVIRNVWSAGDPTVLFGPDAHAPLPEA